jgi:hemin uptake protein HemP
MNLRRCLPIVTIILTACVATPPIDTAKNQQFRLPVLAPASLGRSLSLSQLINGDYNGQTYRLRYETEISTTRLAVAVLSPLGVTLSTIVQENGELAIETYVKEKVAFDPRYTLFDLYLTYWPSETLRDALAPLGMQLVDSANGLGREVETANGNVIAKVVYPSKNKGNSEIIIQHFDIPYRLRITPLVARRTR